MNEYISGVYDKLQSNPTNQDLDFFIEAHSRIGYLAATARGLAEAAEVQLKYDRASAYAEARREGAKSASDAEAIAVVRTKDSADAAVSANEKSQKINNLLQSVEQAINGIKFLGRATDVNIPGLRR